MHRSDDCLPSDAAETTCAKPVTKADSQQGVSGKLMGASIELNNCGVVDARRAMVVYQCAWQSDTTLISTGRCGCVIHTRSCHSFWDISFIKVGNYDPHRAGNTSKAASCATPSRDNLSHRGQWSTLVVVKDVRVTSSRTLFNFPARGYLYNISNIAIWSSLLLLSHSQF